MTVMAALLVAACGKYRPPRSSDNLVTPPVTPEPGKVLLIAWGAPWCENCKRDLPEMTQLILAQPAATSNRIVAQLLVTSGTSPSKKPDEELSIAYRDQYAPIFEVAVDPWRWKTFEKYFGKKYQLPAAVVLDEKGNLIKAFAPGTFVPQETMSVIKEALKKKGRDE